MESYNKVNLIRGIAGELNNCNDIKFWLQCCMIYTSDFPRNKIEYSVTPINTHANIEQLKDMQFITKKHVSEWWEIIQNNKNKHPTFMTKNIQGIPIFRICKITPDLFFVSVFCQRINGVYFGGIFKANLS